MGEGKKVTGLIIIIIEQDVHCSLIQTWPNEAPARVLYIVRQYAERLFAPTRKEHQTEK